MDAIVMVMFALCCILLTGGLMGALWWYSHQSTPSPTPTATASATTASPAGITISTGPVAPTVAPTTAAPVPTTTPAPLMQYNNQDLNGTALGSSSTDPKTCAALCRNNPSCAAYTTDWQGKQCNLKSNPTNFSYNQSMIAYAPASVGTPAPSSLNLNNYKGWNVESSNGNIGQGVAVADGNACKTLCQNTAGCAGVVTDFNEKNCWLKSVGDLTWTNPGIYNSYVAQGLQAPYVEFQGIDYPGWDISSMQANPAQCQAACAALNNCTTYSTDSAGTTCWLKSQPGAGVYNASRNTYFLPSWTPDPPATIYSDAGFSGKSATVQVGDYGWIVDNLKFPNDALSSARVPQGYTLTLYDNAGFGGASVTLTSDTNYVSNFNDRTSSLKYHKS